MSFFRGGGVFILGVLLLVFLLVGNTLLVLSSSLDYENVENNLQPIVKDFVDDKLNSSFTEENMQMLKYYCLNNSIFVINQTYKFEISCEDINTKTPEQIINSEIDEFIYDSYYKDYSCSFNIFKSDSCFKENPLPIFIVSEQSKDYLRSKFYTTLFISFLIVALMFLLLEDKRNILLIVGILLVISSLPFMKFGAFSSFSSNEYFVKISSVFFKNSYKIFLNVFILGIFISLVGVGLKFWKKDEKKFITLEEAREMFSLKKKKDSVSKKFKKISYK